MLRILKGLNCYNEDTNYYKPYGFQCTSTIRNAPHDLKVTKFNLVLSNGEANYYNPNYEKGDIGQILRLVACERAFLAYLAFFGQLMEPQPFRSLNKAKLYEIRKLVPKGFEEYSPELVQKLLWLLQDSDWFRDGHAINALHNFLTALVHNVFGSLSPNKLKSPVRDRKFICVPFRRMDGEYEHNQWNIFNDLVNLVTKPLLQEFPHIVETYYSYKPILTHKTLSLEINVIISCRFTGLTTVVNNLFASKEGHYYHKLFPKVENIGFDLNIFAKTDSKAIENENNFGKSCPNDLFMKNRSLLGFRTVEAYLKQSKLDDFSSTENESSPDKSKTSQTSGSSKASQGSNNLFGEVFGSSIELGNFITLFSNHLKYLTLYTLDKPQSKNSTPTISLPFTPTPPEMVGFKPAEMAENASNTPRRSTRPKKKRLKVRLTELK